MTENSSFLHFMAISSVIAHSFGVQGRFTILRGLTKKSSFFVFYGRFHELLPTVLGSRTTYMFERYDQKLVVSAFYGRFHVLLPIVFGFQVDLHVSELWPRTRLFAFYGHFISYCPQFWYSGAIYMFESFDQKVVIFEFYGRFHELLPIVLGFQLKFHV